MTQTTPERRSIRVRLDDRPGSLADLARIVAEEGANVVRFEVASHDGDQVWDDLELETSEGTTLSSVVRGLRSAGYEVVGLPRSWSLRDWAIQIVAAMADIAEMTDPGSAQDRLFEAIRATARTDHGLVLSDDPLGDATVARRRWEALEAAANDVDPEAVTRSGDPAAIDMASAALRSIENHSPKPSRSRFGGAALLLGGTPRRGVVVALGGRPPFLPGEIERLRRLVQIIGPWLTRLQPAVVA